MWRSDWGAWTIAGTACGLCVRTHTHTHTHTQNHPNWTITSNCAVLIFQMIRCKSTTNNMTCEKFDLTCKIRWKSNFGQVGLESARDQLCTQKTVYLKSKLQHNLTRSVTMWPRNRLSYHPAVFFYHFLLSANFLPPPPPKQKHNRPLSKTLFSHFLDF